MKYRSRMVHKCTVDRRPTDVENPDGTEATPDYEVYTDSQVCKWWQNIGRGDFSTIDREVIANQSVMMVPKADDLAIGDRIRDIRTLRGNSVTNYQWRITNIIDRTNSDAHVILLDKL